MPPPNSIHKSFEWYRVTYAITNPNGKDYARIDFFKGGTKVGQILFGSAVTPGSYASIHGDEIHLYFPLAHFESICQLLRHEKNLSLYIDLDPSANPNIGGIKTAN
jgi:hypothetical protein